MEYKVKRQILHYLDFSRKEDITDMDFTEIDENKLQQLMKIFGFRKIR